MFRIASTEWERLDKEIMRMKESDQARIVLSAEVVPTDDKVNLEKELRQASLNLSDICEFEADVHEDHGALVCEKAVDDGISDVVRDSINRMNALGTLYVAGFQAEVYRNDELITLIFGDSYRATAILPHESGRSLVVLQLEFTI